MNLKLTSYTTCCNEDAYHNKESLNFTSSNAESRLIKVYDQPLGWHPFQGVGTSFTDSSAFLYRTMSTENKTLLLDSVFNINKLSIGRIPLGGCDFSTDPAYQVHTSPDDGQLKMLDFRQERESKYPFAVEAASYITDDLKLCLSPWSPPAYMKNNNKVINGGQLMPHYYERYSNILAKGVCYAENEFDLNIAWMTSQNEPEAWQNWESCQYTAIDESRFAEAFLSPKLPEHVRLLCHDHNLHNIMEKVPIYFDRTSCFAGMAFHWYGGDHSDALRYLASRYSNKEFINTEACCSLSLYLSNPIKMAERYAAAMIDAFNCGCSGWIDWNMVLNMNGGPSWIKNPCAATVMYDDEKDQLFFTPAWWYVGHIARYVQRGAVVVVTSSYDSHYGPRILGFKNPDNSLALVVLNTASYSQRYRIGYKGLVTPFIEMPARSIATYLFDSTV